MSNQPELNPDPPAEIENDWEVEETVGNAYKCSRAIQSHGIDLTEAGLLTPDEDREWEAACGIFERLLVAAEGRVAKVSAERRRAEADDD